MPTPTFTAPPTAPARTDAPPTFRSRATAFVAWFATLYTELVAFVTWMVAQVATVTGIATDLEAAADAVAAATNLLGKSTSTLTVGAGTKTITFTSPASGFAALDQVHIILRSDPTVRMIGTIAASPAPTATGFNVDVVSSGVIGAGEFSNWLVVHAAFLASGATAAEILAGATDAAGITPKGQMDALAPVSIGYASTLVLNMNDGWHRRCSAVSASFTLGVFTNAHPGQPFVIDLVNTAGSIVLAVNAVWDFPDGLLGVLNPANGAKNKIVGIVDEVDGSGNVTRGTICVLPGLA